MLATRVTSRLGPASLLPRCNFSIQERFTDYIDHELKMMQAAGTYKDERLITSQQSGRITSKFTTADDSRSVLNLCANNYLGWCNQPGKPCFVSFPVPCFISCSLFYFLFPVLFPDSLSYFLLRRYYGCWEAIY